MVDSSLHGREPETMSRARGTERGFTLIEVLISILITMIVMASVFALLTRGQRSFQREPEIVDLQQSARTALDIVSKDLLQAGSGLPPEFPAFSRIGGAGNGAPTDVLEIIGVTQTGGASYILPEEVIAMPAADTVTTAGTITNLEVGNIVVVYNDVPNNDSAVPPRSPRWAMARVTAVDETGPNAILTLDYAELGDYSFPPNASPVWAEYAPDPTLRQVPRITRVTIVRYRTVTDVAGNYTGPPPELLMRSVRDTPPDEPESPVAYLEDFQIAYVIGSAAPFEQDDPPNPVLDIAAGTPLTADNMLSSVRITVTARSITANMEGASEGGAGAQDNFIRRTFSTNVNPRNLSAGLEWRALNSP